MNPLDLQIIQAYVNENIDDFHQRKLASLQRLTLFTKQGYLKVVGQNFWYLISENPDLYTDIIEPIGYRAKEHNELFMKGRAALENKLNGEFITNYCDDSGAIDWTRFVQANSMNLDLDRLLSEG